MKRLAIVVLAWMGGMAALGQSPGKFVHAGAMMTPRTGHTATLLKDGRVLITGGSQENNLGVFTVFASAEMYDPSTGTFTAAGNMTIPRYDHTATLLPDGRVLIAGGLNRTAASNPGTRAEVYDPATQTFTPTGDLIAPHDSHTANLLGNGKVLVTGRPTAELYNPATGVFTLAGPANNYGSSSTALLQDGRVLIPGPDGILLYDVLPDSLRLAASFPGSYAYQTTTLLAKGKVLITGGQGNAFDATLNEASLYDPRRGTLEGTGLLLFSREGHSATLLSDGHVLIVGGYDGDAYDTGIPALTDGEDYDPSTGSFTSAGSLVHIRNYGTATPLPDGTVLIAGGTDDPDAELYIPPLRAVSSASLGDPLAPESQASLFGSRLAGTTESASPLSPPTSLGGISLRVTDSTGTARMAPLFNVSPSRIDFKVPTGTAAGKVTLEVVNARSEVNKTTAKIESVAPALFTNDDNTVVSSTTRFERRRIPSDNRPFQLILSATGIRNRSSLANVQCTVGGISVLVDYAGPNDNGVPGLDQVNVTFLSTLKGGLADLVLTVDGIPSNTVSIDVPSPGRN